MSALTEKIAARLDAIKPRINCIVCDSPTRSDDWLCCACAKAAATSANKRPADRLKDRT
jgi:hypothetical protein